MPAPRDLLFHTVVDDELYDEVCNLIGERVVLASVWEDSLAEALTSRAGDPERTLDKATAGDECTLDLDLYLAGGVYFELYGVNLYDSPDSEPVCGMADAQARLHDLVRGGALLGEVAVDEEDALVLVLHTGDAPALYLAAGGFVLEEWDELPV